MLATESYECSGCGAAMVYQAGRMLCEYCGVSQALPKATQLRQTFKQGISLDDYRREARSHLSRLSTTALAVDCEGCGADLIFEPPDSIQHCPFCNRQTLTLPRPADPALPPMALLPFEVNAMAV